jgi:hypothetical protein
MGGVRSPDRRRANGLSLEQRHDRSGGSRSPHRSTLWDSHEYTSHVELYFGYGGRVLYRGKNARAGAGWGGRWRMSIDEGNSGRNSTHQVEAGGDFLAGRLRPGATVRIPLDDDTGANLAIGLSLGVVLD